MGEKAQLQGANPDFALHTIGWQAFQDLAVSIAEVEYGRPVTRVAKVADHGRDGSFYGLPDEPLASPDKRETTIQCKHFSNPSSKLRVSSLTEELESVRKLAAAGKADGYVLITNSNLTEADREKVAAALKSCGIGRPYVFGRDWVTAKILEYPKVRALVPRVYGLGEVSWITDEKAREQAKAILGSMGDDLRCYVPTEAHRDAVHALDEHRIVLLLGDPAVGKSTIAAALAVAATDEANSEVFYVRNPEEFISNWDPAIEDRLFWIDDAFGSVRYAAELSDRWNHVFQTLHAAIKRNNRFILTSRNYIWRQAASELKVSALPALSEGRVVVNVENLSAAEKERILYNHLKFGKQDRNFLRRARPYLEDLTRSRHFRPEIARRLGDPKYTDSVEVSPDGLKDFFENAEKFLRDTLSNLERSLQAAVGLLFLKGGRVTIPFQGDDASKLIEELYGVSLADIRAAMENMRGSFVVRVDEDDVSFWTYKHPTIADAFSRLIGERGDLITLYVHGAKLRLIVREATCGTSHVRGSNVKIPASLYPDLIGRFKSSGQVPADDLRRFLAFRCGDAFFKRFVGELPNQVPWGKTFTRPASRDLGYLIGLRAAKANCLPDKAQLSIYLALKSQIAEADFSFLEDDGIELLLTEDQLQELLQAARSVVLEDLDSIIEAEADTYEIGWDVDSHFDELRSSLSILENLFEGDSDVIDSIEAARDSIRSQEITLRDREDDYYPDDDLHDVGKPAVSSSGRSIFDDLIG